MATHSAIITVALFTLAIATGTMRAADEKPGKGWIQGTVTDEKGKGLKGAEIHAQRVDNRGITGITTTDRQGRYLFKKLPVGSYSITAFVDGTAVSRANISTSNTGWAKVNFDLRLNANGTDGVDRMQRDVRINSSATSTGGRSGGF